MDFSSNQVERQLLETAAGQAVYDSLVQANVNIRTASLELVKQMLVAECRHRRMLGAFDSGCAVAAC